MSVKIMALEAENVKRIKAVALTPSPTGLTIVGGNNNQGKTSVLDALAWALGGDRFRPDAAQRDGAVAPASLQGDSFEPTITRSLTRNRRKHK